MVYPILSERKAHAISMALMLIGFGILTYFRIWWPLLLLVIGLPLALRQYLLGRKYDMAITLFVSVGAFLTIQFNIAWEVILPILFIAGGVYVLLREFILKKEEEIPTNKKDDNEG